MKRQNFFLELKFQRKFRFYMNFRFQKVYRNKISVKYYENHEKHGIIIAKRVPEAHTKTRAQIKNFLICSETSD